MFNLINRSFHSFKINRFVYLILAGSLAIFATLFALFFLGKAAVNPENAVSNFSLLLVITALGLVLLMTTVFRQIFILFKHLKNHQGASRLSLSFALRMLFTALFPVILIGGFAFLFLSYDLSKTFNTQLNEALGDGLQISRSSIAMRANQGIWQLRAIAEAINFMNYPELLSSIEKLRRQAEAEELVVFDQQANVLAYAHSNLEIMAPQSLDIVQLSLTMDNPEYFEFINENNRYGIKIISRVDRLNKEPYYLQALFPMPNAFNLLADNVRESYTRYQRYSFLQPHIHTSLLLVLFLVLGLTVLSSLWLSIIFGQIMTRPVRQLIEATKNVSKGDYSKPITAMPNNELGLLGNRFNAMLLSLHDARKLNTEIQAKLAEQNLFLSTVLEHITAGVISLDKENNLQLFNQSAAKILDCDLSSLLNKKVSLIEKNSLGELLLEISSERVEKNAWSKELTISRFGNRKFLICYGSPLAESEELLLVFEDITEFQQKERNAAWEEVARRFAHEIKNPLTPIRLQSERLQNKLTSKLEDADSLRILDKATTTIINQVIAMERIVGDFGKYAKPLELRKTKIKINELLAEIAEFYPHLKWQLDLSPDLPEVNADAVQLRQVLINLVKNSIEAFNGAEEDVEIYCQSLRLDADFVEIRLEDNGSGFADLKKDPFEPYFTSKAKGTGLGLAIVKKIINEHGGKISAGHGRIKKGASMLFTLPICLGERVKVIGER